MMDGATKDWDPGDRRWLAAILVVAAVLRLAFLNPYGVYFYDELFQYVEQAWRQVSGDGIVTWDIRDQIRPPLLPLLLSLPMRLGVAIGGSAFAGIVALRVTVALAGLVAVAAAWRIGRRWSPLHGVTAAAVMAIWYEAILFSDHVLSEPLATSAFLAGAAFAEPGASRRRLAVAGLLLGLGAVLRFQYAPAIALFAALSVGWRQWPWLLAGALIAFGAEAVADLASGMIPFEWVVNNIRGNIIEGRMAAVSTMGPSYYLANLSHAWGGLLLVPIIMVAARAGRRALPFAAAAAVVVVLHQLIGHKEYRYILLAVLIIILLAGIGTGTVARQLVARGWRMRNAVLVLLAAWGAASAWAAWRNDAALAIERDEEPLLRALRGFGDDPQVCGIAVTPDALGGLSKAYVGRPLPIYVLTPQRLIDPAVRAEDSLGYNAALMPRGSLLPGFKEARCLGDGGLCVQRRAGGCRPSASLRAQEVQAFFEVHGY